MLALVVLLAGAATWFVIAWTQTRSDWTAANDAWVRASNDLLRAERDDSIEFARTRDEVTRAGQAGIITFHTLDYRKIDEGLDAWERSSTGALHDELVARRTSAKQSIASAKTVTSAEALSVAVTELDARAGSASMIAAMKVTVTLDGKQPEQKFMRVQATLRRADGSWKLSGLSQVDFDR